MTTFEVVQVEAYAGHKGAERPLAFTFRGRRFTVAQVLDRWYEGGRTARDQRLDYFKVRLAEGGEFILRYNALFDSWALMVKEGLPLPGEGPASEH